MDTIKLRGQLEIDEGRVEAVYADHLGYPTFGIGHLIISRDPEKGQSLGTPVSEGRVNSAFDDDIVIVLDDCVILYPDFYEKPEEVQQIVANMMFNMGRPRLTEFKNMKKAVDVQDWMRAADEMVDSNWYEQVTERADRLVQRMRNV